jgi:hypothetical protein
MEQSHALSRLAELFCYVDDFWLRFEPQWKANRLVES